MIYEFKGVCHHCAEEVTIVLHNGELLSNCLSCEEAPFSIRQIAGVVYIVSNPNQRGVKIGQTSKTVEARVKSLNTTGVPGSFDVIAIFPTDKPKVAEKKVHTKLKRLKIEKEHFDIEPIDAVLAAYRALNKKVDPIFYDDSVLSEIFELKLKEAKVQMQLKLKGKK